MTLHPQDAASESQFLSYRPVWRHEVMVHPLVGLLVIGGFVTDDCVHWALSPQGLCYHHGTDIDELPVGGVIVERYYGSWSVLAESLRALLLP